MGWGGRKETHKCSLANSRRNEDSDQGPPTSDKLRRLCPSSICSLKKTLQEIKRLQCPDAHFKSWHLHGKGSIFQKGSRKACLQEWFICGKRRPSTLEKQRCAMRMRQHHMMHAITMFCKRVSIKIKIKCSRFLFIFDK